MSKLILPPFETPSLAHPMISKAEAAFGFGKFQRIAHRGEGTIGACRATVAKAIMRSGGNAVQGWQIHLWPNLFFEALAHFAWRKPSGEVIDLTLKYPTDLSQYSLFAVQRQTPFLESLHNRYFVLDDAPEVHVLLDAVRRQDDNRRSIEGIIQDRLGAVIVGRLLDYANAREKSVLDDDERWVGIAIRSCQEFVARKQKSPPARTFAVPYRHLEARPTSALGRT